MNSDKNSPQTAETIAQILANVLVRRFTEDREATGAEKSGISPKRMD